VEKDEALILTFTKPGGIQESLRLMLQTIQGIRLIGQANNSRSALAMMREWNPSSILLDIDVSEEAFLFIEKVKTEMKTIRIVVIAGGLQQIKMAEAAGADHVLMRGFSINELKRALSLNMI
jgi:DNA-binding NarL/FixJ family response regulator